jgi:hypothetical protein
MDIGPQSSVSWKFVEYAFEPDFVGDSEKTAS